MEINICPICKKKVRVYEPKQGGTHWHEDEHFHFNCYFDNYNYGHDNKQSRTTIQENGD